MSAVGQFPTVFGLPYSETFTKLDCIDEQLYAGKLLMIELKSHVELSLLGKEFVSKALLKFLKVAKECKDDLEVAVGDSATGGASDDLRELNNKLHRAITQLTKELEKDGVLSDPAHWTRTLNDLEHLKLSAVGQFPNVYGLPYRETFTKLDCIDEQLYAGKILMIELEGRVELSYLGEGFVSRALLKFLKVAKECKDDLEAAIPATSAAPQ